MKKRRLGSFFVLVIVLCVIFFGRYGYGQKAEVPGTASGAFEIIRSVARSLLSGEPEEVAALREAEVAQTDEGHQEYYFRQLGDEERRVYREMLNGVRERKENFYVTLSDDDTVNRIYHAVLKDHPELFWAHNREKIYKTTYTDSDYCTFSPGYIYTEAEIKEIRSAMEEAYQNVLAQIPEGADDYEKVQTVYTYVIDNTAYQESNDDQSIAGTFWKKEAVCAGYAGAVQYLLERLGVSCIYVDGSAAGSTEGHAWNIVKLDGEYYYVDATNGDQPDFLNGDAAQLVEHKTTVYDYLCPFPLEYESVYTASSEFEVPECTSTAMNFYVLNQGCFDTYDWQSVYDYCKMRLDNGAAVVRFKFSGQEAFGQAFDEWITGGSVQDVAQYYMQLHGMRQVEYHYGVLDNLNTIYFIF
nr:transglutaminase domain-containing protein [uncultured Blautia sp.]